MTFLPENSQSPFLATSTVIPDNLPELIVRLTHYLNDIAYRVNAREIAFYEISELLTGQSWFQQSTGNSSQAFRKVYVIPNIMIGTNSVPHELGDISNFTFTHIYGTMNMGFIPFFCPIPQSNNPDDIAVTVDATNVNVICPTAIYTAGTAVIILEYLKN